MAFNTDAFWHPVSKMQISLSSSPRLSKSLIFASCTAGEFVVLCPMHDTPTTNGAHPQSSPIDTPDTVSPPAFRCTAASRSLATLGKDGVVIAAALVFLRFSLQRHHAWLIRATAKSNGGRPKCCIKSSSISHRKNAPKNTERGYSGLAPLAIVWLARPSLL